MKNTLFYSLILFFSPSFVFAQSDSIQTHELQEVEVSSSRRTMSSDLFSGATSLSLPAEVLTQMQNTSLSDFLAKGTPLFVKETGNGMLSTISLRGTSASHTKVNWEDIPINSQTMGQVDLSQLPLVFFDEVNVHPGGEGAVYGNGAIGGAITLSGKLSFQDTFSLQVHSSYGSFQSLYESLKCRVGNEKIQSNTALFYRRSDNDFKFDFRKERQVQQNASFYDYGVLENLVFHLTPKNSIGVKLWHTYYDRDIQPMMQNNMDERKYESISNRSTKVLLDYVQESNLLWKMRLGWLADDQWYESHLIATDDWLAQSSVEKSWRKASKVRVDLKVGGDLHAIRPEVYAYMDSLMEWNGSLYALSKFVVNRFELTCNLRKNFVTNLKVPFSPSISINYHFIRNEKNNLSAQFLCSRNVNVPTLNDRYWGKIDNRNITPEKGADLEVNVKYGYKTDCYFMQWQSALYRNDVSDWILWMPRGNIWKPTNIDRVMAKGVEVALNQMVKWNENTASLDLNYAYNHTEIKEGFSNMSVFKGRQMPLLPRHTASACLYGNIHSFQYSLLGKWVGPRTTSDIFDQLDDYFILNMTVDYLFRIGKKEEKRYLHTIDVGVQGNNLLNTVYQTMPYRAMPLRNFMVFLKYNVNRKSTIVK